MASNNPEFPDKTGIFENLKDKIEKAFASTGVSGVTRLLDDLLNDWKSKKMRIAVIGSAKSGKSSFINAIRNLKANDKRAAKVGPVQVTMTNHEYPSPENPNLIYVDVPGVDTPDFPRETYLNDIKVDKYDFYIIVSQGTLTVNVLWLAQEIKSKGKSFLILRTKIDSDLETEEENYPSDYNETETLNKIRLEYITKMKGLEENHIYLISNRPQYALKWDFPRLRETLVNEFPVNKREAFILSLRSTIGDTESLILLKKKYLQRRAALLSAASAVSGAVPIPGISALVDVPMMVRESNFYRCQLGLDDESAKSLNDLKPDIASNIRQKIPSLAFKYSVDTVLKLATQFGAEIVLGQVVKAIPIIGSIFGAGLSYALTLRIMSQILDDYTKVALEMNKYIHERVLEDSNSILEGSNEDINQAMGDNNGAVGNSNCLFGNKNGGNEASIADAQTSSDEYSPGSLKK